MFIFIELSVVMLVVIIMVVIMLSVLMLSVIRLNVVALFGGSLSPSLTSLSCRFLQKRLDHNTFYCRY
jgi:hypothetical protein